MRLEQERAERGAQCQRHDQRDHRRRGDGDGELTEELAEDAGQEGRGNEHRRQNERDGDQRAADLLHGAIGRVARTQALADVALDVLDHDDGVVDHDADGEHETEQREIVQREAEGRQHGEGADQRHRDGDDGDDRGAPGLQEQDDHHHDEDDCLEHGLDHGLDGLRDEDGRVVDDVVAQPGGNDFDSSAIAFCTSAAVASAFEPGRWKMPKGIATRSSR